MLNDNLKGTVLIIFSAFAFGLMPTLSKLSIKEGLNTSSILTLRFCIASLLIWGYIFIKGIPFKTTRNHIFYLMAISLAYVGTSANYFGALNYISSHIAVLILYLHPTLIVAFEIFVLKREKDLRKIVALVISTLGIASIVLSGNIHINGKGILLSLGAAVFYTIYILGLEEKRTKEVNSIAVTGYILLFSAATYLSKSLITNTFYLPQTMKAFYYVLTFAVVSSVFAIFAFCTGVKLIGASKSSIISTLEPVFATILGLYIFKETLTPSSFVGGALILTAVVILQSKGDIKKLIFSRSKA